MNNDEEWYSLCYEDIIAVAKERNIELDEDDLKHIADLASGMIDWSTAIACALDVRENE
jgi:hypothetical protein